MSAGWITLVLCCAQGAAPSEPDLERWVRTLDEAHDPEWTLALEQLGALGEPAARRVLADFEHHAFTARRARAELLARVSAPECWERVRTLLGDSDPEVRRLLAQWTGNPGLAGAAAEERVRALEALALADPDSRVRDRAREALGQCALEEAVPALDRLLDRLPVDEAELAARALVQQPLARERLIARLAGGAARASTALPDEVRAALLAGYGRALAEVPGGGEERRERWPLTLGRSDPSPAIQAAAHFALASFVARAAELSEEARAERVLAALGQEGWPPVECLRRRLDLAWLERGDPAGALELALALEREAQGLAPEEAESWELRAALFQGAAWTALDRRGEARAVFDAQIPRQQGILGRRTDLFPSPSAGRFSESGGAATVDHLHLLALTHLWRALLWFEEDPEDAGVARELRAAHVCFLEARVTAQRTEAPDPSTLDSLFERDLSPYTLLLFNEKLAPEHRGPGLDRAKALARAWGRVAPLEMQGLADDSPDPALGDVFLDPERLALLRALRQAERADLQWQDDDLDQPALGPSDPDWRASRRVQIRQRFFMLRKAEEDEQERLSEERKEAGGRALSGAALRAVHAQLLEYLTPSMHALTLAGALRADGRSKEALALCEQALATLRTAPLGSSTWSELSSARFSILQGSALMDENRPAEAELAFIDSERRLAAIEASVEDWRQAGPDPEAARASLGQIRNLRGDALLSLAVNANVRLGDPARALGYFERAYALNQSPFMRVLRACYRARSGKADEARTVLASVVAVPSLYYNIACTHALLGEKEAALDYLERDFRANAPTPGARTQKRDWARKDPDLASLRGEPRFERLLEDA